MLQPPEYGVRRECWVYLLALRMAEMGCSWLKYRNDTEGRDKTFSLALLYLGHPYQNSSNFRLFKAYLSEKHLVSI